MPRVHENTLWRTSFVALGGLFGLALSGCGSSSDPAASANGGSGSQAGSLGSQSGSTSGGGGGGAATSAGSGGVSSPSGGSAGASAGANSGGTPGVAGAATGGTSGDGSITSGGSGGAGGAPVTTPLDKFSFFVTSMSAMLKLAPPNGFGGDLTFGEADGLAGADKICATIAETSMPGSSVKQWRAFLSTTKVNAATRIGAGPWYDRTGRLLADSLANLLQVRPNGANAAIKEDLPNETGTPNHRPDPTKPEDDNHHVLTGSDGQGKLYGATATCKDWTTNEKNNTATGRPRIGFSWSIQNRTNWISGQDEGGCGAGVAVGENGASDPSNPIVGSGGGYGGIYCFALTP